VSDQSHKVIVLGAGGMLGQSIRQQVQSVSSTHSPDRWLFLARNELDITNHKKVNDQLNTVRPDWIINTAACTNVDAAEDELANQAEVVNHLAVANLAHICKELDIRLLHISTDYIFSGTPPHPEGWSELDIPNPANHYGQTKLKGEIAIRQMDVEHLIIRTSWLFAEHGRNFVRSIIAKMLEPGDGPIPIVNDQRSKPTYTSDLTNAILKLINTDHRGTFHIANTGSATWYEFAKHVHHRLTTPGDARSSTGFQPVYPTKPGATGRAESAEPYPCDAGSSTGFQPVNPTKSDATASSNTKVKLKPITPCASDELKQSAARPTDSTLNCARYEKTIGTPLPHWHEALDMILEHMSNP